MEITQQISLINVVRASLRGYDLQPADKILIFKLADQINITTCCVEEPSVKAHWVLHLLWLALYLVTG